MPLIKRQIQIGHQMLKQFVRIYAEDKGKASRIRYEKIVGGRKFDLVGEKDNRKVLFEVEGERLKPEYVEEYFDFCKEKSPYSAYLVAPETIAETRRFREERRYYEDRGAFLILPIKDIFDYVLGAYYLSWEIIDGKLTLVLSPKA